MERGRTRAEAGRGPQRTQVSEQGHGRARAGTAPKVGAALLCALVAAAAWAGKGADRAAKDEARALRKQEKERAQLEKKQAAWRKLPAYELGRREGLAEAAAQCAAQGKVVVPPDPYARPRPRGDEPQDWRAAPLYGAPRARRPYVNGYLSCLRAHGHDPRYRDELPVAPPQTPPPEEELPPQTEAEREYLGQHARELWDDGVKRCEQDLAGGKAAPTPAPR